MTDAAGRHRSSRGSTGLLVLSALVLLTAGFLAGLLTVHLMGSQSSDGSSAESADAPDPDSPSSGPAVTSEPPDAASPSTTSAAPPDPGPEAGDTRAFFDALQRSGVPVEENQEVLLALASGICHTPPESRTDPAATAQHIVAVLGDKWAAEEATRIVEAVDATLC